MNKGNKLLLGILAFIVVCVVGYALFSESITVTGTATASGDWSITTTCTNGDAYGFLLNEYDYLKEGGYVDKQCSVSSNKVTISSELQYPTASRMHTVELKNTGSIDAVLKFDKPISGDAYPSAINLIDANISLYNKKTDVLYKTYNAKDNVEEFNNYAIVYVANAYIIIKKEDGSIIDDDESFIANNRLYKDSEKNNYLKIYPGESILVYFVSEWPENAEQTDYYGVVSTEYEFKMQQFVDSFELETEETLCIGGC